MTAFRRGLALFEDVSAVSMLVIMSVLVFLQVVYRYIFATPLSWSDELARYLFVWASFIGSSIAVRKGGHFAMEILQHSMPRPLRRAVTLLNFMAIMGLLAVLTYYGALQVDRTNAQLSPGLQMPMSWAYLSIPVSCVLMLLEVLFLMIDTLRGEEAGQEVQ